MEGQVAATVHSRQGTQSTEPRSATNIVVHRASGAALPFADHRASGTLHGFAIYGQNNL